MVSMIHGIVEIIQGECKPKICLTAVYGMMNVRSGNLGNCIFTAVLFVNALKIVRPRPNIFDGTRRLVRSSIVVRLTQLGDGRQIGADQL
jgi:hypothetical protein